MPWLVNGFFKLITPFIDPMTREKLKFGGDMRPHVPPEQLWNEFQGDLAFEYDHETYWPAFIKICKERYEQKYERWVKAGKLIGESEFYLKGGDVAFSVGANQAGKEEEYIVPSVDEDKAVSAPVEPSQIPVQKDIPLQEPKISHGNQSLGNRDVAANIPAPVLSTEGDRA